MSSSAKSNIKAVEPSAHGLKKYCFFASDADFQLAEQICVFLGEQRSPILRDAMRRGLVVLDKLDSVEDTPGKVSRTALYLSQVQVAHADAIGQRMGLYRALILRAAMHHGLKAIHAELVKDFGFTDW